LTLFLIGFNPFGRGLVVSGKMYDVYYNGGSSEEME